ncbi:MAG: hypothetical protein G01um101416_623 [Microgenomates group bacterium Gr01-1014_16]|nr:MAG: hypothetical protein G01um101416_623 [Microgenomates group bacterium Gr01-1014_16]
MYKVFAEPPLDDFCINRIAHALKLYAPPNVKFVTDETEADLVVLYAHGRKKSIWWSICRLKEQNRQAAVVQMQLKSTPNPHTADWLDIWRYAAVVWSYYNLAQLCQEESTPVNFNFYHAPLGVDPSAFTDHNLKRKYTMGIHSKGWSHESLREVVTAAQEAKKSVLVFDNPNDYGAGVFFTGLVKNNDRRMSYWYSQCRYVSGLRRTEGFELPVIEGLMCGARPICFDLPSYRIWFEGLVEFIPESGGRAQIIPALIKLFNQKPRPVSRAEKQQVKEKFNWGSIARGFWERVYEHKI